MTSIDKLTQGAMLYNDHYQVSEIEKNDFEQYLFKIINLSNSNREMIIQLIDTTLENKNTLFFFLDFIYKLFSRFNNKKEVKEITALVKSLIVTIEDKFNDYNALLVDYSQALFAFQNLTEDYIINLKEQEIIAKYT